jgi:probable F420-dependent oxidoreductase
VSGISVSVQAEPSGRDQWLALARRLEVSGFRALLLGDHPGSGASPWPALGAAAAVTRTLLLGSYVTQAGVREPMHVAAEAVSLNVLAPGRVLLGLGAGHTPREWHDLGRERPAPGERAARLAEFAEVTGRLLRGEAVTFAGAHLTLRDARLEGFPPGPPVRLAVGGGHAVILRAGARHADVISVAQLGATLADGHHHEVHWSPARLRRQLQVIGAAARAAGTAPELETLVQRVTRTADRAAVLAEIGARFPGVPPADISAAPFQLIGTYPEMAAQLRAQAADLGITSYVVREPDVTHLEQVLRLLRG